MSVYLLLWCISTASCFYNGATPPRQIYIMQYVVDILLLFPLLRRRPACTDLWPGCAVGPFSCQSNTTHELTYLEHKQKKEVRVCYALKLLEEILRQESDEIVLGGGYIIILQHAAASSELHTHTYTQTHSDIISLHFIYSNHDYYS